MTTAKTIFNSVQELCEDMIKNCKTFSRGIYVTTKTGKFAVDCELYFDEFEFKDDNLTSGDNELIFSQFDEHRDYSNVYFYIHNIVGGHRLGNPEETEIFEYSFYLKDVDEPFTMLAYGYDLDDKPRKEVK